MMKSALLTSALALPLMLASACKTDSPAPTTPTAGETAKSPASATVAGGAPAAPSTTTAPNTAAPTPRPSLPPLNDGSSDGAQTDDDRRRMSREERRAQRTAQLDTNGDGTISEDERVAAMRERTAAMHARL